MQASLLKRLSASLDKLIAGTQETSRVLIFRKGKTRSSVDMANHNTILMLQRLLSLCLSDPQYDGIRLGSGYVIA